MRRDKDKVVVVRLSGKKEASFARYSHSVRGQEGSTYTHVYVENLRGRLGICALSLYMMSSPACSRGIGSGTQFSLGKRRPRELWMAR